MTEQAIIQRISQEEVVSTTRAAIRQLHLLPTSGRDCHHRSRVSLSLEKVLRSVTKREGDSPDFATLGATDPDTYQEVVAWLVEAHRIGVTL
jgi:aminoglycoside phosphotransferase